MKRKVSDAMNKAISDFIKLHECQPEHIFLNPETYRQFITEMDGQPVGDYNGDKKFHGYQLIETTDCDVNAVIAYRDEKETVIPVQLSGSQRHPYKLQRYSPPMYTIVRTGGE